MIDTAGTNVAPPTDHIDTRDILEDLRCREAAARAAASSSSDDVDRRAHEEFAQLIYARRKRLEARRTS
jgi:hypothetical protein